MGVVPKRAAACGMRLALLWAVCAAPANAAGPATQPTGAALVTQQFLDVLNGAAPPPHAPWSPTTIALLQQQFKGDRLWGKFRLEGVAATENRALAFTDTQYGQHGRAYTLALELEHAEGLWTVKRFHGHGVADAEPNLIQFISQTGAKMIYRASLVVPPPTTQETVVAADDPRAAKPPQSALEAACRLAAVLSAPRGQTAEPWFDAAQGPDPVRVEAMKGELKAPRFGLALVMADEQKGIVHLTAGRTAKGEDRKWHARLLRREDGWYVAMPMLTETGPPELTVAREVSNGWQARVLIGPDPTTRPAAPDGARAGRPQPRRSETGIATTRPATAP